MRRQCARMIRMCSLAAAMLTVSAVAALAQEEPAAEEPPAASPTAADEPTPTSLDELLDLVAVGTVADVVGTC